jgi:hypothetical protein
VNGFKVTAAELRAGDRLVLGYGATVEPGGRLPTTPGPSLCLDVLSPKQTGSSTVAPQHTEESRAPLAALSQSSDADTQRALQSQSQSQSQGVAMVSATGQSCETVPATCRSDVTDLPESHEVRDRERKLNREAKTKEDKRQQEESTAQDPQPQHSSPQQQRGLQGAQSSEAEDETSKKPGASNHKTKVKVKSKQARMLRELEFSSPGPAMVAVSAVAQTVAVASVTTAVTEQSSAGAADSGKGDCDADTCGAGADAGPAAVLFASSAEWANDAITEELQCAICRYILVEPHSIPCSHSFCGPCLHGWLASCRDTSLVSLAKASKKRKRRGCTEKSDHRLELPCPVCRTSIVSKPVLVRSLRAAVDAVSSATHAAWKAQPMSTTKAALGTAAAAAAEAVQREIADRSERRAEWETLRKTRPVRYGLNAAGEVVALEDSSGPAICTSTRAGRAAAAKAAAAAAGPFDPFDAFQFGGEQSVGNVAGSRRGRRRAVPGRHRRGQQHDDEDEDVEDDDNDEDDDFGDEREDDVGIDDAAEEESINAQHIDGAQEGEGESRPGKVQRRANSACQQDGRSNPVDGSPLSSQGQQPSLHAFFDSTTRDKACAEADAAAAEADAARSAAAVADAAAANEQQDCWVEAEGQVAASVEEAFDIGVDSLFD